MPPPAPPPPPDEVPWLDDDEQRTWLALVGLVIRLPAALDAQLRRDAGLSHFDYQVLAVLSAASDHTMAMKDLAGSTEGSLSRLSHACSRLEARGWVRRRADPTDGRVTLAVLTDAGHAELVAAAPGHVHEVRRLVFDPLTRAQVAQLGAAARRIDAVLGPPAA